MKLKLVAASLSVLGLISCPTFAADVGAQTKHKHHHDVVSKNRVAHYHAMQPEIENSSVNVPTMAPVSPVTMVTPCSSITLTEMTQNIGRAFPCPDWFNRIGVSGGINFDFGKWVRNRGDFQGENYKHFSLNDAYLNLTANVNDWTKAFVSLSYSNPTSTDFIDSDDFGYSNVYALNKLSLEQGYITIGNFDCSPVFLQLGKQFTDFSRYEIHPITRSLTQVLSEALATEFKIGFVVPMGFHGAVYALDDPLYNAHRHSYYSTDFVENNVYYHNHHRSQRVDWGVALGYDHPCECLGYDIGVGYVNSMTAAQDVAHAVSNFTGGNIHKRVGAFAFYGDINSGPFTVGVRYTTAASNFDRRDLPNARPFSYYRSIYDFTDLNLNRRHRDGAKPWAAGIQAGYAYNMWCKNQNVFVGYQTSNKAAGIGIPKNRWLAGWGIDVCKNTGFGFEWDHNKAYGTHNRRFANIIPLDGTRTHHHRTNGTEDLFSLRADVKFG